MKVSKRFANVDGKIDKNKQYDISEAVKLLKECSTAKFDESIDIAINLNLKAKHTIRDTLTLPNPIAVANVRVLVFAEGETVEEAKAAGADFIGSDDLIEKIEGGWTDFDVAIATPAMMKKISKLGKHLGRKGLMPNPKTGTVTQDVKKAIAEFKKGKQEFRANKQGVVHQRIAKSSMTEAMILENANAFYKEIMRKKPSDLKGKYVLSIALSSTMGPGIKVNYQSFSD